MIDRALTFSPRLFSRAHSRIIAIIMLGDRAKPKTPRTREQDRTVDRRAAVFFSFFFSLSFLSTVDNDGAVFLLFSSSPSSRARLQTLFLLLHSSFITPCVLRNENGACPRLTRQFLLSFPSLTYSFHG